MGESELITIYITDQSLPRFQKVAPLKFLVARTKISTVGKGDLRVTRSGMFDCLWPMIFWEYGIGIDMSNSADNYEWMVKAL